MQFARAPEAIFDRQEAHASASFYILRILLRTVSVFSVIVMCALLSLHRAHTTAFHLSHLAECTRHPQITPSSFFNVGSFRFVSSDAARFLYYCSSTLLPNVYSTCIPSLGFCKPTLFSILSLLFLYTLRKTCSIRIRISIRSQCTPSSIELF